MSSPNSQRPPTLRYLKAKLTPFKSPLFLGSLGFLSVFAFAAWQYWHHPEWIESTMDQTEVAISSLPEESREMLANSDISVEELAAAAEIDSLPLLLNDFKDVPPPSLPESPVSRVKSETLFEDPILQAQGANPTSEITEQTGQNERLINPFGNTGLFVNVKPADSSDNPTSTLASLTSLNVATSRSQTQPLSPLQTALEQLASATSGSERVTAEEDKGEQMTKESQRNASQQETLQAQSSGNVTQPSQVSSPYTPPTSPPYLPGQINYSAYPYPTTSTNPYTPATPTQTYPPNAYTYLTQPQPVTPAVPNPNYGQYVMPGVAQPGTVGNTNPPVYPGFPQSQLNQSALSSPFGTQPAVTPVPRSNFDTPRPVPGRNIGGGRINTFSNP